MQKCTVTHSFSITVFLSFYFSPSLPDIKPSDDLVLSDDDDDDLTNSYSAATLKDFSKLLISLQNANDLMKTVHFHVITNASTNGTQSLDVSDEGLNDLERGWV